MEQMAHARARTGWVDATRAIALLLLVAAHCCDPFNSPLLEQTPERALWGSVYLSVLRPCVPLFVMVTGYLLLPGREECYGTFYRKRILRVLWPFLIWSVLYNCFPYVVFRMSESPEAAQATVQSFFSFAEHADGRATAVLRDVLRIPFDFSGYNTHMWYVFLLIGLYLVIPFISPWCAKATNRRKAWFLGICAAASFIPFLRCYGGFYDDPAYLQSGHLFGFCEWNDTGMLHYFTGFIGYLVLGMVLGGMKEWTWRRTLAVALPLVVAGYVLTFGLFQAVKNVPGCTNVMLEQPISVTSFNVVMMSAAMFLIGRKLHVRGAAARLCASLGICSFGVYMCHYFFVGAAYTACASISIPTPVLIPAATAAALAASWAFVALLKRLFGKLLWLLG